MAPAPHTTSPFTRPSWLSCDSQSICTTLRRHAEYHVLALHHDPHLLMCATLHAWTVWCSTMGVPHTNVILLALPSTVLHLSLSTSRRSALPRGALKLCLVWASQPILLIVMHTSFLSLTLRAPTAFTLMVLARLMPLRLAPSPLTANPVPTVSHPLLHHFRRRPSSPLLPLLISRPGLRRLSLWLFVLMVSRRLRRAPLPLVAAPPWMRYPLLPHVSI